jgi:ABC-type nitrate/sulfonate/bicarbonate transport system substrate-binding protein
MTGITDLKRSVVGVIGGETNRKLVQVLTDEYDLTRASVTFKDLAPSDARRALESKQVRAVLIVVPLAEKYLSLLRSLFTWNQKGAGSRSH